MAKVITHPIDIAAKNGYRYKSDLENVLSNLASTIELKKVNGLKNRLLNSKSAHSIEEYIQAGCEIIIIDYIIRNFQGFDYEPKYNGRKNPECSFVYKDRTINVEIKCPNFEKRKIQESSPGIKVLAVDRIPDFDSVKSDVNNYFTIGENVVNFLDRMDNKIKDYLKSANVKFPQSDNSNFNILIVGLEILEDFDEWYNYLFSTTGIFNSDEILVSEEYENVDAIMFTNCRAGLINTEKLKNVNIWHLENSLNILFLKPTKVTTETGTFYFKYGLDIFGEHSRSFIQDFLQELEIDVKSNQLSPSDEQATNISMISSYFEWLKSTIDNNSRQDELKHWNTT